jgi:predicted short-subunit dehydrogenase-like oxidoreductase (DUF2520 family)
MKILKLIISVVEAKKDSIKIKIVASSTVKPKVIKIDCTGFNGLGGKMVLSI